jgi:hypothetical protein
MFSVHVNLTILLSALDVVRFHQHQQQPHVYVRVAIHHQQHHNVILSHVQIYHVVYMIQQHQHVYVHHQHGVEINVNIIIHNIVGSMV